jgi:hypothetical protein
MHQALLSREPAAKRDPRAVHGLLLAAVLSLLAGCAGNTENSPPPADTQPPTAPTNLTANAVSSSQINLAWTASTDNAGVTGYKVERCQGAGCSNFAQIATPTGTTFNDTGLTASTSYIYRLRATDAANNLSGYSNTATATTGAAGPVTVTISPRRGSLTTSQTQQFTATVSGSTNTNVTWEVDTILGGNSASGTISASALYTPSASTTPGLHMITARSVADTSATASASFAVTDLAGMFTYHNDNARTGVNSKEYALAPTTVSSSTFGKLFSCPVDGYVYAQPLYVANLAIPGKGTHNVVIVATENDSVYALDADNPGCVQYWKASMLKTGEVPVPAGDTEETEDLKPIIGVTSTPVIDPTTSTVYVCAKSKNPTTTSYFHRLHALSLADGTEKFGGPVDITATGFVPLFHLQRPGLLLANNTVYLAFGSQGDRNQWHGWLFGYNPATLAQKFVWTTSDLGANNQASIWQSGNGVPADGSGNVYVETGNGTFDADAGGTNYGDSIVKLSPTGTVLDFFTPHDEASLNQQDIDLGNCGVLVLPDQYGSAAHPHLALGCGKNGLMYLLDQDNMGKFNSTTENVVQVVTVNLNTSSPTGGMYGQPAFWNGNIYAMGVGIPMKQYTIAAGSATIATPPKAQSPTTYAQRAGTPAVSANGNTNGVVWALDNSNYGPFTTPPGPAILHAYDATDISRELFSSPSSGSGASGNAVKFTVPTVANGKVYVGGQGVLAVFGLLP